MLNSKVARIDPIKKFSFFTLCLSALAAQCLFLTSCSSPHRFASRQDFDFSRIERILVKGDRRIKAMVNRDLLYMGFSPITESKKHKSKVDAILSVNIVQETPQSQYLVKSTVRKTEVQTSRTTASEQTTNIATIQEETGHDPVPLTSDFPYTRYVSGEPGSVVVGNYAKVLLSGELFHPENHEVLWVGSYSSEALDIADAMEQAVQGLLEHLPKGK
ncbi:hypothetical protein ACFL6Y_07400 [Elusimicrobiota bacterium]